MDAHRHSQISGSFSPFTEKEAPPPGWPLFIINVFFPSRGEPGGVGVGVSALVIQVRAIRLYVRVCGGWGMCMCMCARACVRVCVCARARACVRVCVCVRARAHACVRARRRLSECQVVSVCVSFTLYD